MDHISAYKRNPGVDGDSSDDDLSDDDAPSVSVRTSSGKTEYVAPSRIDLVADASDSDGRVDNVTFYVDGELLKQENYDPYEATMTDPGAGPYTVIAVATDDDGQVTTSAPVTITVTESGGTLLVEPGVHYAYYEASDFKSIRDLDGMTPVATGQANNFDIGIAQRQDKFGFVFTGYVDIPADGTYTFATISDDGSGLWIGRQQVVSNDGLHGPRKRSGQIQLTKGYHPITVKYIESEIGQTLDVFWSSASIAEALIPDSRLVPDRPSFAQTSIHQQRSGASSDSPSRIDLEALAATWDGDDAILSWQTASEPAAAGFVVERKVPSGTWSRVGHVAGVTSPSAQPSYRFEDRALPYQADRLVYRLRHVNPNGTEAFSDEVTLSRKAVQQLQLLSTFPNPAQHRVTLRYALPQQGETGPVSLHLYDLLGRRIRQVPILSRAGRHETQVDVSGLATGVYYLRLVADGEVRTRRLTVAR